MSIKQLLPGRKRFRFAHLTDLHIQTEHGAAQGVDLAIRKVLSLRPPVDFVTTGGDLVNDAYSSRRPLARLQFNLLQEAFSHLRIPLFHALGNRDVFAWGLREEELQRHPEYGKQMFLRMLGQESTYLSFDVGDWHFVVLDTIARVPPSDWRAEIDEQQMEWLRGDLRRVGTGRPTVFIAHVPLFTIYPQYYAESASIPMDKLIVANRQEVHRLMVQYNVRAVLQGHSHVVEECIYRGTHFITCGAVSGDWWRGHRFGVHPEGFVLVDVDQDGFTWRYVPYGWRARTNSGGY